MCFILGFSIRLIRVKSYDFFLITHILLALGTLVTLFYHTSERFSGEYDYFLWPCVAFWAFDRLCRIGRVCYFSVSGELKKSMVTFSDEDEVIRVDVTGIFRNRRISGGSHFFLCEIPKITSEVETLLTKRQIFALCTIWLAKPSLYVGTLERVRTRWFRFSRFRIRR